MTETTETGSMAAGLGRVDKPLFAITGGFIAMFCTLALYNIDLLSRMVDWGFNFAATYFGLYWQVLLLATFLIILMLSVVAPIVRNFWFTIIGGTGIALEQATPGLISGPFKGFNLPQACWPPSRRRRWASCGRCSS